MSSIGEIHEMVNVGRRRDALSSRARRFIDL